MMDFAICDSMEIVFMKFQVQVESHHYCSHVSGDMRQCVIYDSNKSDARLIGIEYIISGELFQKLPEEEKKYWHSHEFEVGLAFIYWHPSVSEYIGIYCKHLAKQCRFECWILQQNDVFKGAVSQICVDIMPSIQPVAWFSLPSMSSIFHS